MISLQEIKPRQIRALLLLLVLAPLIPTGLLLRFMFDTVVQERETARETIANAWQDSLTIALHAQGNLLKNEPTSTPDPRALAEKIVATLQRSFEHEVRAHVLSADQSVLAGTGEIKVADGAPVASVDISQWLPGARVELFLADRSFVREAVQEQIATYTTTACITIAANMAIALVAGWAFLRQIRNQELKSSTLATLAHELRTPVASMRLLLDTMQEGRCPDQPAYLALLARENDRLSHLVDQFLTHSRLELGTHALTFGPVDPAALVKLTEENLAQKLQAPGCHYRHEIADDLPLFAGDQAALVCLLGNLLDNAWKYTGPEKEIALQVSRAPDGITFSVRDNGIGIPAEQQKAIFRRFHQVDQRLARTAEGCGLGLSIAQRIVEMHRGRIRLESTPGQGSRFTIWLPAASAKPPAGLG